MTSIIDVIKERRSIRSYTDAKLSEADIQTIIEAGRYAPTAMSQQPWHFYVVRNTAILAAIEEGCKAAMASSGNARLEEIANMPGYSALYKAPVLIFIACDETAMAPLVDSALAMQNMFLAATAMGIGSCWIHAASMLLSADEAGQLRSMVRIPDGHKVYASAVFGYIAGEKPQAPPRVDRPVQMID